MLLYLRLGPILFSLPQFNIYETSSTGGAPKALVAKIDNAIAILVMPIPLHILQSSCFIKELSLGPHRSMN
jgi:hypothetical protein